MGDSIIKSIIRIYIFLNYLHVPIDPYFRRTHQQAGGEGLACAG